MFFRVRSTVATKSICRPWCDLACLARLCCVQPRNFPRRVGGGEQGRPSPLIYTLSGMLDYQQQIFGISRPTTPYIRPQKRQAINFWIFAEICACPDRMQTFSTLTDSPADFTTNHVSNSFSTKNNLFIENITIFPEQRIWFQITCVFTILIIHFHYRETHRGANTTFYYQ